MFQVPGATGIFCIGIAAGYYFGRFFDKTPTITAPQLVSLLTLLGVGPAALVLVQGYLNVYLLDPYGIGLLSGMVINFCLRGVDSYLARRAIPVETPAVDHAPAAGAHAARPSPEPATGFTFLRAVTATASGAPSPVGAIQTRVGLVFERRPEITGSVIEVYEVPATSARTAAAARMWLERDLAGEAGQERSKRWILVCDSLDALNRGREYEARSGLRSIAEALETARSGWWIEADPGYVTRLLS